MPDGGDDDLATLLGRLDCRVPIGLAFELFRTLQSRGVASRLIYCPNAIHWILKPNPIN